MILTDIIKYPWIDKVIDANDIALQEESLDAIILRHMIHHIANPMVFLKKLSSYLKPKGLILISEVNTSFMMKVLLRIMRHEGWNYNVNIFSTREVMNNPDDPWSANCAIPEMLFKDPGKFEENLKEYSIIHQKFTEFLIFPLSGGVIAKSKTVNLPVGFLKIIDMLDKLLINVSPRTFALGKEIVLQKN